MTNVTERVRDDAAVRVLMPNQNLQSAGARRSPRPLRQPVGDATATRRKRVAPRVRQRDLTKYMKAAKAAGMASFELIDMEAGFIIRAFTEIQGPVTSDDLDDELARFVERVGG